MGGCNEGDIVLDPFMGSGSTAEAALRNNRAVVGFEIKKDYCELIASRLEKHFRRENVENSQLTLGQLVNSY